MPAEFANTLASFKYGLSAPVRAISVLALMAVVALTVSLGCQSDDEGGPTGSHAIDAFVINSVVPAEGAIDVAIDSSVVATFNRALNPSSISTASFFVNGVDGSVSVSGSAATFTPAASLSWAADYTITITSDAADMDGVSLSNSFTSTFATVDPNVFRVISISPLDSATAVMPEDTIKVSFNRDLDTATVNDTSVIVFTAPTGILPINILSKSGASIEFKPNGLMAKGTEYYVVLHSFITDTGGVALRKFNSSFRTISNATARAGADQDASFGASIKLDGSQSMVPAGETATYTWEQVSGPTVTLNASESVQTIFAPDTVGTVGIRLTVNSETGRSRPDTMFIRVFENKDKAFFVATRGNDGYPGTMSMPLKTIQGGIAAAFNAGTGYGVYVGAGTHTAVAVVVYEGTSLYGGFNSKSWYHDVDSYETTIEGGKTAVVGIDAHNAKIDGFTIKSAPGDTQYQSSIGIALLTSNAVHITRNTILTGAGYRGEAGDPGSGGKDGSAGGDAYINSQNQYAPGSGGTGHPHDGGKGGSPGALTASNGEGSTGMDGAAGEVPLSAGAVGGSGKDAKDGNHGAKGDSCGTAAGLSYLPAPGGRGGNGGRGGGGAGGQGGQSTWPGHFTAGGGGGGGGSGGGGGEGGTGGGGSIGILLSGSFQIVATGNEITPSIGGNGGWGGVRGIRGTRGGKGSGFSDENTVNPGGDGGYGGYGGWGGYGGGGGGGPAISIFIYGSGLNNQQTAEADNVFHIGSSGGGGPRPDGNYGFPGATAPVVKK